jgi:hypothetical protein
MSANRSEENRAFRMARLSRDLLIQRHVELVRAATRLKVFEP